jgi:hypothetical protein
MDLTFHIPDELWEKMYSHAREKGISEDEFKQEFEEQLKVYMETIMMIVADNLEEGMPPEMVNIWQAEKSLEFSQDRWKKFYEGRE